MKNSVNYKINDIEITINSYKGVPCYKWGHWCYRHRIIMECNGIKKTFYFHNNNIAYNARQIYLNADDMKQVLDCILSDALAYDNTMGFADFSNEFGYDDLDEYKSARKAYEGCKNTFFKLQDMGLDGETITIIQNYIREE